jgi:hypothetical protein
MLRSNLCVCEFLPALSSTKYADVLTQTTHTHFCYLTHSQCALEET